MFDTLAHLMKNSGPVPASGVCPSDEVADITYVLNVPGPVLTTFPVTVPHPALIDPVCTMELVDEVSGLGAATAESKRKWPSKAM